VDIKTLVDVPPWEWPSNAANLFLETLNNHRADESDRRMAAELAGDLTVMSDESG
jgi:hypothetical protein